ncbi:hypothetical protein CTA1_158 [Colletotrichum tanaceti]|uniref:Uncharacterized protein n=1 Tax=Colletotrichum tanaceti TaxID=1306861 RepID=A0A4U6X1K0_9PEZI|nr:hypothetical protein CTA1_158 [Colletotrichum tanaceti]
MAQPPVEAQSPEVAVWCLATWAIHTGHQLLPGKCPVLPTQFPKDSSSQRLMRRAYLLTRDPLSGAANSGVPVFLPSDVVERVEVELARLGEDVLSDRVISWITEPVARHVPSAEQGPADAQEGHPARAVVDPRVQVVLGRHRRGHDDPPREDAERHQRLLRADEEAQPPLRRPWPDEPGVSPARGWGTQALPTVEIGTILTLTRVHLAVAAVGYVGRGHAGRGRLMPLSESP